VFKFILPSLRLAILPPPLSLSLVRCFVFLLEAYRCSCVFLAFAANDSGDLTIAISGERALAGSSSTESRYIPSDLVARAHFEQEAGTRWPPAKIARGVFETDLARSDRGRAITSLISPKPFSSRGKCPLSASLAENKALPGSEDQIVSFDNVR